MISCSRKIEFDAAHRIRKHESKCRHLHGHRYVLEAHFAANELDELGRVIDFSQIKEILGSWIDENFDHNTILAEDDKNLGDEIHKITKQKIFYLPNHPTAENMVKFLFEEICPKLFADKDIKCVKMRLYETPNCFAEIS